jgi:putative transposase
MSIVEQLARHVGVSKACQALGVPRSSLYRARQPSGPPAETPQPRPPSPRALSPEEQQRVREVLNSPRFRDDSPREVYATLLDEQTYLCHWRTMYRILAQSNEVRERRNQLRHPTYVKPELVATQPRQLWSWDITKLLGPAKWVYYYLYVILDVYSRYAVGWMVAQAESADLAHQLIAETCAKEGIEPGQLTLHADRGSSMQSKSVALLLADLGVLPSHSRPRVSNDNPYSEAHFKTLKYRPDYPERFGCPADARVWARDFFHWYNNTHHHISLGLLTPAMVHHGQAPAVLQARRQVLQVAYAAHPERFVRGQPTPRELPSEVWINRPQPNHLELEPVSMQFPSVRPLSEQLVASETVALQGGPPEAYDTIVIP